MNEPRWYDAIFVPPLRLLNRFVRWLSTRIATMTPDREEEALRLARTGDRSQMTRGDMSLLIDALAADLEAAERRVSKLEGDLDVSIQTGKLLVEQRDAAERDLTTAREALDYYVNRGGPLAVLVDALRSLGEKA